jgi:hypothetical protein
MRQEKKYELMLLRLRYLKKELEFTKETNRETQASFSIAFNNFVSKLPPDHLEKFRNLFKKDNTPAENLDENRKTRKKIRAPVKTEKKKREIQKLFKEVAKNSHPDTILDLSEVEQEEKKELFKKAQTAAENSDFFDLIEVAESLQIELPEASSENIDMLKDSIAKINADIKKIKNSFSWVWYHSEEEKDLIMRKYFEKLKFSYPAGA